MKILKVLVLLLSIAGASLVVWNATREKGSSSNPEEAAVDPDDPFSDPESDPFGQPTKIDPNDMQVSPKSGGILDSDEVFDLLNVKFKSKITDAEVKATRDRMMMSSKSGLVMSEDEVRKMLEGEAKEKEKFQMQQSLMHSSKSFGGPLLEIEDLEKIIEKKKEQPEEKSEAKPHLMHSSKKIDAILDRHDLEKIIEGDKKQKQPESVLPPQE